jgi:hypothetical protein
MPEYDHTPVVPADSGDIYGWHQMPHASEERERDYPLSTMCEYPGCLTPPLIKPTIAEPWRHRLPGERINERAPRDELEDW